MKVRLLSNGGYDGLEAVEFPVIVNGYRDLKKWPDDMVLTPLSELKRIGGDEDYFGSNEWPFRIGTECEVLE